MFQRPYFNEMKARKPSYFCKYIIFLWKSLKDKDKLRHYVAKIKLLEHAHEGGRAQVYLNRENIF